jgi:hypothetical protein
MPLSGNFFLCFPTHLCIFHFLGPVWGTLLPCLLLASTSNQHAITPPHTLSASVFTFPSSHFNPEDESSMVPQNNDIQPPHYIAQQPRKWRILSSSPWKPEVL